MPKLIVAAPERPSGVLQRMQAALCEEWGALGINVDPVIGGIFEPEPNAVLVVLCTASQAPEVDLGRCPSTLALIVGGAGIPRDSAGTRGTSAMHAGGESPIAGLLCGAAGVFATDVSGIRLAEGVGVPASRLHCGYTSGWDHRPRADERDIDVVLHVPPSSAARAAAGRLAMQLEHLDVRVLLTDEALTAAGPIEDRAQDRRGRFLARACTFVALAGGEASWLPCVEAMLAGAALVAEDPTSLEPLQPGRDLLCSSLESMPSTLIALLADGQRRHQLTSRAYMTLRLDLPLHRAAAELYEAARVLPLHCDDHPGG